ncbi:MAG: hypothetical protein EPN91_10100 [Salinibacterium sp.]|nr:MAG: hypothetical protein EPN91_10100 [Salinibacterium sp.]
MSWAHTPIDARLGRVAAAEAAADWGFPRLIDPAEVLCGHWFRMGWRVIWWFEAPMANFPGALGVHVAVSPAYRRRWPVRTWQCHVEREGRRIGASKIVVADSPGAGHVAAYLRRLGWSLDGPVWVLQLGG